MCREKIDERDDGREGSQQVAEYLLQECPRDKEGE